MIEPEGGRGRQGWEGTGKRRIGIGRGNTGSSTWGGKLSDVPRRHPQKGEGPGKAGHQRHQGGKSIAGEPGSAGERQRGARVGCGHPLKLPRGHEKKLGPEKKAARRPEGMGPGKSGDKGSGMAGTGKGQ